MVQPSMRTNGVAKTETPGSAGGFGKRRAARSRRHKRLRANARSCRDGTAAPRDDYGQNGKHYARPYRRHITIRQHSGRSILRAKEKPRGLSTLGEPIVRASLDLGWVGWAACCNSGANAPCNGGSAFVLTPPPRPWHSHY